MNTLFAFQYYLLPKSNPIENLYMMMCKQLLGVQKQTTNIGVLLELGRVPLYFFAIKAAIKNWERIKKGQANILLMASYNDAIMNKLPWIVGIKSVLENNAMLVFLLTSITPINHLYITNYSSDYVISFIKTHLRQ